MFSIISSISFFVLTILIWTIYRKQKREDSIKPTFFKQFSSTLSQTEKIVLGGLSICFLYLFASGFYFSLLSLHRMFGIPLILHITMGGLFAIFFSLALIFYSRYFCTFKHKKDAPKLTLKSKNILFWLFTASTFSLITTSLCMMVPIFVYQAQVVLFDIHRYSALVSVLTSLLFLYIAFTKNEKKTSQK
jgi:hypothetical protein